MNEIRTGKPVFPAHPSFRMLLLAALLLAAACGCERLPPDEVKLRDGVRCEAKGEFDRAEELYREACALGNGEAYGKLAGLFLNQETTPLFLESGKRDEAWVGRAKVAVEKLSMAGLQAEAHGCEVAGLKESLAKFEEVVKNAEERIATEKAALEAARRAAERKAAEEARLEAERQRAERAMLEAARRAAEEKEREETARREAERKAREAEAARQAAEQRKRESADYCIANGVPLTRAAYREISEAMNYHQNTGNSLVDDEENARQHARYRGKRAVVQGKIEKVDGKLLGGVKIKVDVYGSGVWLNFPNMTPAEGKMFRVGQTITAAGEIGDAFLADLKFNNCHIR